MRQAHSGELGWVFLFPQERNLVSMTEDMKASFRLEILKMINDPRLTSEEVIERAEKLSKWVETGITKPMSIHDLAVNG